MFSATCLAAAADAAPKIVDTMLDHNAIGVLALAFVVLLVLFWRADRRAGQYARHIAGLIDELKKAHVNEGELIEVIRANTTVSGQVAAQLAAIADTQKGHTEVNRLIERRLTLWQCPFRDELQQQQKGNAT